MCYVYDGHLIKYVICAEDFCWGGIIEGCNYVYPVN